MTESASKQNLRVQYAFLAAAVRFAQSRPDLLDKKRAVIGHLYDARMRMIKLGHYSIPNSITSLIRSIETLGSVNAVRKQLLAAGANVSPVIEPEPTPVSNTGVTPQQLSIQEDFISGKC